MKPRLFALMFATCCFVAATGHAQSTDFSPRERDDLARAHFRAGSRYFELRRYAEAAGEFERVFELSGQTPLLYNAGRAWEAADRPREAVSAYERFLAGNTEGIDRAAIQESLTALRARVAQSAQSQPAATAAATSCAEPPTSTPVTTPVSTPVSTPATPPVITGPLLGLQTRVRYEHNTPNMVAPWLCLGVGAVLGGMAVWQGLLSAADNSRVTSATQWTPQLTSSYFAARDEGTTALVLTGLGATAVVGGVVWLIARGPGERREEVLRTASVTIAPNASGATLVIGGVM